jgi:hypothetical protein
MRLAPDPEESAITQAALLRTRCICQEDTPTTPCECTPPITRPQITRLTNYLSLNPDRAVIYSEKTAEWLSALHSHLPQTEDPIAAWLQAPHHLPPAANLHHAPTLETLLDNLHAPNPADLS